MKKVSTFFDNVVVRRFFLSVGLLCAVLFIGFDSDAGNKKGGKGKTPASAHVTKKSDGSIVVNTTELGKGIKGFRGETPLEVTFKKGKVVSVKALPNNETPKFFMKLTKSGFFDSWNGMTVKEAATKDVDAVTGASYSSKAVKANVKAAAEHLLEK